MLGLFPTIDPIPRDDGSCPICSDDYTLEEAPLKCVLRRMTCCNKSIGESCLINWMSENISCPFCRRDWTTEVENVLRNLT